MDHLEVDQAAACSFRHAEARVLHNLLENIYNYTYQEHLEVTLKALFKPSYCGK